jgi:YVTN family beta-propeller protein
MLRTLVQAARTCEEVSVLPRVARNTIVLPFATFAIMVFVGCGGNSSGSNTQHSKAVVSIQIAPSNPSIVLGSQQQFTATAVFDDASQQDVTSSAKWTSSELSKAGINNSGIATSVDIGRPQITATYGSFTASTRLTIVIGSTPPVARFGFAFAEDNKNTFYRYVVDGATGLLRPSGYFTPLGEQGEGIPPVPLGPVVDPRGKFLYFYYPKILPLYVFSIDPASGAPSPVADSPFDLANVPTGLGEPRSLLLDPSGVFAYIWDSGVTNGQVFAFDVDPQTGAFTTVQTLMVGTQGGELAIDPFGRFLYSGNLAFAIDPSTGKLTQTSAGGAALTISPDGRFAFGISDICSGKISAFTVSATNGALTEVTGSPFAAGPDTYGLAVDPSGKFLYTAQAGSCDFESVPGAVSVFSIGASGALSPAGQGLALPYSAYSIQIDPTGKFAYVQVESFPSGGASVGIDVVSISAGQQLRLMGGTLGDRLALSPGHAPVTYTPQSLYAVNAGSNNVSTYGINPSGGALTLQATLPAGSSPRAIAVTPQRQFAYVVNQNSNNASIYAVNNSNGALASLGTIATGTAPSSIAMDLIGSSIYVANSASNDLSAFSIDTSTGSLTPLLLNGPFATGTTPSALAISPFEEYLLGANSGSGDVSVFYLDPASGYPIPVPSGIGVFPGSPQVFVAYDPMGRFFYVCSQTNQISTYAAPFLTLVATTSAGTQPMAMAFDPTGRFTYIVDAAANNVLTYAIDPNNGSLISTGTVATGSHPVSITVEPSGEFVYVANQDSNDISIYSADPNTGTLKPERTVPAGTHPVSLAATATAK